MRLARPLPIDGVIDDALRSLQQTPRLVVEAAPGAGKTTRLPRAILEACLGGGDAEVWVLQPRRLAARLAAGFVSAELGERLGGVVGYQVRHEDVSGPQTRLRFVTEGIAVRRLLADRTLAGVGTVVLDEFHERHLDGDLMLALLRRMQNNERRDLRVVVMSATLDADRLAGHLDGCPRIRVDARRFDVDIEHAPKIDRRPLQDRVRSAVAKVTADGDVLVFLPGVGEIRRCMLALESLTQQRDLLVLPLHGSLSVAEQDRAMAPAAQRKIILSTNVAETSVTIDGITSVIDGGLARVACQTYSGLSSLRLQKISKASATQRAGRAGRTQPGRCMRLYTKADFDHRPQNDAPEIERLELSTVVLMVGALGHSIGSLDWLDAPPPTALAVAERLLSRLGAVDGDGVTDLGHRMLALPAHPRQARVALECAERGVGDVGCTVAALLGERDLMVRDALPEAIGISDVLVRLEALEQAKRARFDPRRLRKIGVNPVAARSVARVADQLRRAVGKTPTGGDVDSAVRQAVLAGYPDRVAAARQAGGQRRGRREYRLSHGGRVEAAAHSVVHAPWVVVIDAEERHGSARRNAVAHVLSAIEPEWLIDVCTTDLRDERTFVWNHKAERVDIVERLSYGELALFDDERRAAAEPCREAGDVLLGAVRGGDELGFLAASEAEQVRGLLGRIATLANAAGTLDVSLPESIDLHGTIRELCAGCVSFAELRGGVVASALRSQLPTATDTRIDEWVPATTTLPGGRRLRIHYQPNRPPWVESVVQDFFGMQNGPAVVGGRLPLTLHLLAPNRRAMQVTADLAGFWSQHYPALRKSLSRRYPKHDWPQDPLSARPPRPRSRRRKR